MPDFRDLIGFKIGIFNPIFEKVYFLKEMLNQFGAVLSLYKVRTLSSEQKT